MPVLVSDIWRLKTYIATAISEATGEYIKKDNVTIESLKEVNQEFDISGKCDVFLSEGKTHDYRVKISTDSKISYLSVDDKQIIS